MSVDPAARDGLLGFAVERQDHTEHETAFLENFLLFEVNDHGEESDHSSEHNPFQAFLWGDYTAKPGYSYTYTVTAMHGAPGSLEPGDSVELEVKPRTPTSGSTPSSSTEARLPLRPTSASSASGLPTRSPTTRHTSGSRAGSRRRCSSSSLKPKGPAGA